MCEHTLGLEALDMVRADTVRLRNMEADMEADEDGNFSATLDSIDRVKEVMSDMLEVLEAVELQLVEDAEAGHCGAWTANWKPLYDRVVAAIAKTKKRGR